MIVDTTQTAVECSLQEQVDLWDFNYAYYSAIYPEVFAQRWASAAVEESDDQPQRQFRLF